MPCDRVDLPGSGAAIVRSRRRVKRCQHCPQASKFLCDWKIGGGKTCDEPLCKDHAQEVAPEKHLCPEHQRAYKEWKARQAEKASP